MASFIERTAPERGNMSNKQSYLEKMELKKSSMLAAGLVSDKFPGVSSIVLHMTYYQKTLDPILMKRTINYFPSHYDCFRMECMREECSNGGFDLTPVVANLVKNQKKTSAGKIVCSGKSESLRLGHASIAYEVSIQYAKQEK
jgi:hypothetical protein